VNSVVVNANILFPEFYRYSAGKSYRKTPKLPLKDIDEMQN
jgi:hypothetical protein